MMMTREQVSAAETRGALEWQEGVSSLSMDSQKSTLITYFSGMKRDPKYQALSFEASESNHSPKMKLRRAFYHSPTFGVIIIQVIKITHLELT